MSKRDHVVVVGAGAMGSAAAWRLAAAGARVTLIEQFDLLHQHGASHGRERIFRYGYDDPDYVELAKAARPLWHELEDECGHELLTIAGCIDLGTPEHLEAMRRVLTAAGIAASIIDASEAMERWPMLNLTVPVLVQPDAGRVDAETAIAASIDAAVRLGAEVRLGECVFDVVDEGAAGVTVVTDRDEVRAGSVVLAAGGWAGPLVGRLLGPHRLPPIVVTEELVAFYRPTDDRSRYPCLIDRRTGIDSYALATPTGLVKAGQHGAGPVVDAATRAAARRAGAMSAAPPPAELDSWVAELMPALAQPCESTVTCLYASTPTQDFVIDRVGPIVIAAGFSGHGFKFMPAVGERLARLAMGMRIEPNRWAIDAPRTMSQHGWR